MIPEATFHFAGLLAQAVPLGPGPHNILHTGAPQGSHIEWLYWFIFWITFAVYVLMILGFTRAGAKSGVLSREPLPVSEYPEGDRRAKWAVGAAETRLKRRNRRWRSGGDNSDHVICCSGNQCCHRKAGCGNDDLKKSGDD